MSQYATIKAIIDQVVTTNGQQEITGALLNEVLKAMVDSLGSDYQFGGVVVPTSNVGSPDQNVFYIATQGGTYTYFGNVILPNGLSFLMWKGSWTSKIIFSTDDFPTVGSQAFVKSSGLNNIFTSFFRKASVSFIDFSVIDNNGHVITNTSSFGAYKVTDLVTVNAGDIIFISASANFNNSFFAFYDNSANVIQTTLSENISTPQQYRGFVMVPTNAVAVRIAQIYQQQKAFLYSVENTKMFYEHFDEIYDSIINNIAFSLSVDKIQITTQFQKAIGQVITNIISPASEDVAGAMSCYDKRNITNYLPLTFDIIEYSVILSTTGLPTTSGAYGNYKISSPIDVSALDFIYISGSANWLNYIYAFYDANEIFLSGEQGGISGTPIAITKKLVEVPSNAKYVRVAQVNTSVQMDAYSQKYIIQSLSDIENIINPEVEDTISFETNINHIVNANGQVTHVWGGYDISDYIPVTPGNKYIVTGSANFLNYIYAFFDSQKNFVSGRQTTETGSTPEVLTNAQITIPENISYLIVCWVRSANTGAASLLLRKPIAQIVEDVEETLQVQIDDIDNAIFLSGKKWLAIGDSLTAKDTLGSDVDNYVDYVARILDLNKIFNAIGGTGYWRPGSGNNNNFYHRILNYSGATPDIITVFGSLNDLGGGGSDILGTINDNTENTICGCINLALDALISQFPAAAIGIITPTQWSGYYNESNAITYVSLLKQICEKKGLPVLDLFYTSNLHPNIASFRTTYYLNADGVHPNTEGHKRFANQIVAFLKEISFL